MAKDSQCFVDCPSFEGFFYFFYFSLLGNIENHCVCQKGLVVNQEIFEIITQVWMA